LYFRCETAPKAQHAIRRHRLSGIIWKILHFPLTIALVSLGALIYGIIAVESRKRNYYEFYVKDGYLVSEFQAMFGTQLAIIHWCLAAMQLCHLENPIYGTNIPPKIRIVGRIFTGIFFILIAFTAKLSPSAWVYMTSIILFAGVMIEEYGGYIRRPKNRREKRLIERSISQLCESQTNRLFW
jgi:hypothetical protein